MTDSYEFLKSILDTVTDHLVVIDREGKIVFVNRTWRKFGQENFCSFDDDWRKFNYLEICDKSAEMGDDFGIMAAAGIKRVIRNEDDQFFFEYPCHSPDERRWFMMRVTPFEVEGASFFVIAHQNITERKLAEDAALKLSKLDGLTNIPNRRSFDEFLKNEWMRCRRLDMPISLALVDIDHFKLLNDTYGHQAGDDCLKKIGALLDGVAKRPSDICARYGGEEWLYALSGGN